MELLSVPAKPALSPSLSSVELEPSFLEKMLLEGTKLNKYSSKITERLFRIELYPLILTYPSKQKTKSIEFTQIVEIRMGQNTSGFQKYKSKELEERAFSVIYLHEGKYKELNLVAPTMEKCVQWVMGLHILHTEKHKKHDLAGLPDWLRSIWNTVETSGYVEMDHIPRLFQKLGIDFTKSETKSALKEFYVRMFSFEDFVKLYKSLKFRPDIAELFCSISKANPTLISLSEFSQFISQVQKDQWDDERIQQTFSRFSSENGMDLDHFSAFLMSSKNRIFSKMYQKENQDMNRPLNEYFINTSHNTYLTGDQIVSDSSPEGYIRALQRGCRCVELDCWDGPMGDPVIYHGHTLTSKIPFRDVCEAIKKYAFEVTDCPLILSLEVRCSTEQQDRIAEILREVLGEFLLMKPIDGLESGILPSPNQLRGKILVKGKTCVVEPTTSPRSSQTTPEEPNPPTPKLTPRSSIAQLKQLLGGTTEETPKKKEYVSKKLAELVVYLKGRSSKGMDVLVDLLEYDQLYSLNDKKTFQFIQKQKNLYQSMTCQKLCRVYPSFRLSSSNFEPMGLWITGTQMVALNFQTFDRAMELNDALFDTNGGCGYVLKPIWLRQSQEDIKSKRVKIIIISGQQVRKGCTVQIELIGAESDSQKFKTEKANGTNPLWKQEFVFAVAYPELAFLRYHTLTRFEVAEDPNTIFGGFTIALQCIQQGYRHVPLHNRKGDRLGFSTLFVQISVT